MMRIALNDNVTVMKAINAANLTSFYAESGTSMAELW